MKIRIGVATYGLLEEMTTVLQPGSIPGNVELIRINKVFGDLSQEAIRLEKARSVDAFVASGGNAEILDKVIESVPVVRIVITGYDLIEVLKKASLYSGPIGLILYENSSPNAIRAMEVLRDLTGFHIEICTYSTRRQLQNIIDRFKASGIRDVIGGSLALQIAGESGLRCHYMITQAGLVKAIMIAVQMVQSRNKEASLSRHLYSVLDFISEGIIATNQDDLISVCNPSAEKILGIDRINAIGKRVDSILPGTRLNIVRATGKKELDQLQEVGASKIITNRVPIMVEGTPIGALATFRNVSDVENAEAKIKHDLYSKGFVAKYSFKDILGSSSVLKEAIAMAQVYATSDATVFIGGESGTGKELFAQSIHSASERANKPFVAVNCAAMPQELLESELFGYDDGAFTGARRGGKRGLFELADSGTIFLDEIAEVAIDLQARLLRVLEQREVIRLGSERIRRINVRIIAATNKNLRELVFNGSFRADLYYRLNVLTLHLPPLRKRIEDIPELALYYLKKSRGSMDDLMMAHLASSPLLLKYDWPGNIRELRNIVENVSVTYHFYPTPDLALKAVIDSHLQMESQESTSGKDNQPLAHEVTESQIKKALLQCNGNQTKAAVLLGISRSTLWRRLREIKIIEDMNQNT